ncbi:uromodulin-like 1 [Neosynchiropus ocellatus]
MAWVLYIFAAVAVPPLCAAQDLAYDGKSLSMSGFHLCTKNESRNVSVLVVHNVARKEEKPCGGWLLWMTCTVTLYKMIHQTEYREVTRQVTRCCDGYEKVGRYCAPSVKRSDALGAKPGSCPKADGLDPASEDGGRDCEWDIHCPDWQKCCPASNGSVCSDPDSVANAGRYRFNATVTVRTDYQQLLIQNGSLLNHSRILQAMVPGVLQTDPLVYYLASWPVHPHRTATSLLIDSSSALSLDNVRSRLLLLLKHIQEVTSVSVDDRTMIHVLQNTAFRNVDECAHTPLRHCSPHAECTNTVGSYLCACTPGYLDADPVNTGVICAAPAITSVQVANITGTSFCVYWSTGSGDNQAFRVTVHAGSEAVAAWDTNHTMVKVEELKPAVLYNVSVELSIHGNQVHTVHVVVKTEAQAVDASTRLTNVQFTDDLMDRSSEAFRNLSDSITEEIYRAHELEALANSGQLRIEIKNFSPGSVFVNFTIVLIPSESQDITNTSKVVLNSLTDSYKFTVDENSTSITDFDECASGDHDCSQKADCINSWASYTCVCQDGFTDINTQRPGRDCQEYCAHNPINRLQSIHCCTLDPISGTHNPTPCTLNPIDSTHNPTPCTFNPIACTLSLIGSTHNPTPCTLNPINSTHHPTPCTLIPVDSTHNPTPCTLNPINSTHHPTPCTLNPIDSTHNPTPCTLNPINSTHHPTPCTLNPIDSTHNPTPCTLNPIDSTHHPTPCTHNPTPCTLDPIDSTLDPIDSTHNPTPCTLDPIDSTHNPTPCTLDPIDSTHNPTPCTLDPIDIQSLLASISVQCRVAAITVTIARDVLEQCRIMESSLYLGLEDCGVNSNNATHVQLTVAWDECATSLLHNDSAYTVTVMLLNNMKPYVSATGTVEPARVRLQVPIMCTYMRSVLMSADFSSVGYDMIKDAISSSGSFHVTVQLLNGTVPLPHNYTLSSDDVVVVEVSMNTSVEQIKVVIHSCWATTSPNPADAVRYTFLDNRCSLNSYTKVLTNGNSSTSSVSVQIFSFVNAKMIYLHCQVQICVQMGSDTCVPDCVQRTARLSNTIGTAFGSSGPLLNSDGGSVVDEDDTPYVVGFTCLGVILTLCFVIASACVFYCQRNRIGHYNFNVKPKEEKFTYLVFNT